MSQPPLTDEQRAIVEANTGLVGFVLKRRHTPHDEWDDAFQDGLLGLMRAAQKFDPTLGYQFSTYALFWIRQAIQRGHDNELGASHQRAIRRGDDAPPPPLSLDRAARDDGAPLTTMLAAGDDTEADALAAFGHESLLAQLLRACRDPLDLAIIEAACAPDFSRRRIAAEHGVTVEAVRCRLLKMASRTRHPTGRRVA